MTKRLQSRSCPPGRSPIEILLPSRAGEAAGGSQVGQLARLRRRRRLAEFEVSTKLRQSVAAPIERPVGARRHLLAWRSLAASRLFVFAVSRRRNSSRSLSPRNSITISARRSKCSWSARNFRRQIKSMSFRDKSAKIKSESKWRENDDTSRLHSNSHAHSNSNFQPRPEPAQTPRKCPKSRRASDRKLVSLSAGGELRNNWPTFRRVGSRHELEREQS